MTSHEVSKNSRDTFQQKYWSHSISKKCRKQFGMFLFVYLSSLCGYLSQNCFLLSFKINIRYKKVRPETVFKPNEYQSYMRLQINEYQSKVKVKAFFSIDTTNMLQKFNKLKNVPIKFAYFTPKKWDCRKKN